MKIVFLVARLLLGLMFTVFGLNGFLHFIPMQPMPGLAGQYMALLGPTHYLVLVFVLQFVSGVLFLVGRYVPLALTLMGPVLVNILLFHLLLEPNGFVPGILATCLWLIVFIQHRGAFAGIFQAKSAA